jgi:hypothetical protein
LHPDRARNRLSLPLSLQPYDVVEEVVALPRFVDTVRLLISNHLGRGLGHDRVATLPQCMPDRGLPRAGRTCQDISPEHCLPFWVSRRCRLARHDVVSIVVFRNACAQPIPIFFPQEDGRGFRGVEPAAA